MGRYGGLQETAEGELPHRRYSSEESFKFLGLRITDKLKWSIHTYSVVKKAQQRLFNFRRLKKFGQKTVTNFYRCAIESIL